MNKYLFFLLVSLTSTTTYGKIVLPSIFGDNMVLQQNANVSIWGKAAPNTKVTVQTSWNNRKYTVTSTSDSTWKLQVISTKAGGPYKITISDGQTLVLRSMVVFMSVEYGNAFKGIR